MQTASVMNKSEADYSLPIDAKLFPEGCTRCSFTQFALWMGALSVVLLWGIYSAYRVLAEGLGVTGLDDYFGFGLWIAFDLGVIALGAGAFFSGLMMYILNIKELKNIINLAVVVGFLCYTGAMMILVLDIGQPIRAWFGYWHANVHSMLTEVIFCITCYCIVLIIEYIPLVLENRKLSENKVVHTLAHNFHVFMPIFAGIGAFLSTFHQGSLGGMFGVMFSRPYVYREGFFIWPWTFFLFILSAVASGPFFTVLIATAMEKITGKKLVPWKTKQTMAKIAATMLLVYIVFKVLDTWAWITGILPNAGMTFDEQFHGLAYGKWLLWAELFMFGVFPAVMLNIKSLREQPWALYTAGIMVCIGVCINRYVQTVQGLAQPVMPFTSWEFYMPNWAEWGASFLVISYSMLVLSLSYRYLPMFPQEKELNK